MSSKVRIQTLQAGSSAVVTNDTNKPVHIVYQSSSGSRISATLPLGASIEFKLGPESGKLFFYEPHVPPEPLRLVWGARETRP
jgi:hypothetical protein